VKLDAALLAALLKLLISPNKLLFAGPVAVDAADSKLEILLDASAKAVLIPPSARSLPVEIIPLAYDTPVEMAPPT
jgi:hypothetical protein